SDEDLQNLQKYVEAKQKVQEADQAWLESWGTENEGALLEKVQTLETLAKTLEEGVSGDLLADYNTWKSAQPENQGQDLYLDVPLRPSDDSEKTMQGEIAGYSLEGLAEIYAATNSESLIQAALNAMDLTATVTLKPDASALDSFDGSHAGGLWSVPFDGYRAILHKKEAVLTASEAAVWRGEKRESGRASAGGGQVVERPAEPITVNLTVNGVSSSPYAIAGEVRNALELMRWQG
ncbi:MAG: hypothetical protein IKZ00_03015, partial [Bacteroidaceae bacterium]|nr:hypothetical protein [Bacteroidaceae bacterium]